MITKRDCGRWVRIIFWDHCIVASDFPKPRAKPKPVLCECSGMIRSVSNSHITLATWWLSGDKETQDTNAETVVIVRSTIVKYGWCDVLKWWDE